MGMTRANVSFETNARSMYIMDPASTEFNSRYKFRRAFSASARTPPPLSSKPVVNILVVASKHDPDAMTRYDSLVISLNRSVEPSLDRQTLKRLASISACQSILLAGAIAIARAESNVPFTVTFDASIVAHTRLLSSKTSLASVVAFSYRLSDKNSESPHPAYSASTRRASRTRSTGAFSRASSSDHAHASHSASSSKSRP